MIYPLATSLYYSLTKWKGIGNPKVIGLSNYATLLRTPDFWLVTRNTIILCIVCTIGQVGIALVIAFVKQLIALVGTIMFAIKAVIFLAFAAVFVAVAYLVFRSWKDNQARKTKN